MFNLFYPLLSGFIRWTEQIYKGWENFDFLAIYEIIKQKIPGISAEDIKLFCR